MVVPTHILSPDTQAILLLCGRFGQLVDPVAKPLSVNEYDQFAQWLREQRCRPADLLDVDGATILHDRALPFSAARLLALLDRGGSLALAVESWTNAGLWVLGRSDETYPQRLKSRLGRLAPPLLYGIGNAALLTEGGLALVGSRNANAVALDATRAVARTCAEQGIVVVSGGARGVDTEAMLAALDAGGRSTGILADSLARAAVAKKYRQPLLRGDLVLVSPYDPESGFHVGNAMQRNKYVYALADWGLVVDAALGEGGTWAGAIEVLDKGGTSLFVWQGEAVSPGNMALLTRGALPFPTEPWHDLPNILTRSVASVLSRRSAQETLPSVGIPTPLPLPEREDERAPQEAIYSAVLPILRAQLDQPSDAATLSKALNLRPSQLQDWLDRAVAEGVIAKLTRPTRYVLSRHTQASLTLAERQAS